MEKYLQSIPYKERKQFVNLVCLMYRKIQKQESSFKRLHGNKNFSLEKYDVISMFEMILTTLSQVESLIIKKDFLDEKEYTNWYLDHWSKSTYYKHKHEAINKFIYLLFS